jgi:hypothetical protein
MCRFKHKMVIMIVHTIQGLITFILYIFMMNPELF